MANVWLRSDKHHFSNHCFDSIRVRIPRSKMDAQFIRPESLVGIDKVIGPESLLSPVMVSTLAQDGRDLGSIP